LNSSEGSRLSVTLVDVSPDHESDFAVIATALEALLIRLRGELAATATVA